MADFLHLKLSGLRYTADDNAMVLPEGGFCAVFDDIVSSVLYCPEDVKTLELYNIKTDTHFFVYRILGGLQRELTSPHVVLTSSMIIYPNNIEIIRATKIATILRFDIFPVPEWK